MNRDIGYNISTLAKIIGYILLIVPIVLSIVVAYFGGEVVAVLNATNDILISKSGFQILCVLIGILLGAFGYISAWVLYGFGQLVDDTKTIKQDLRGIGEMIYDLISAEDMDEHQKESGQSQNEE